LNHDSRILADRVTLPVGHDRGQELAVLPLKEWFVVILD